MGKLSFTKQEGNVAKIIEKLITTRKMICDVFVPITKKLKHFSFLLVFLRQNEV